MIMRRYIFFRNVPSKINLKQKFSFVLKFFKFKKHINMVKKKLFLDFIRKMEAKM